MSENINSEVTIAADPVEELTDDLVDINSSTDAEDTIDINSIHSDPIYGEDEEKPKKKRLLQLPVIISACIVVVALLGYFVFTAFFLKEPEGVTWSTELDGTPYYFTFNSDGTLEVLVGSAEANTTFEKIKSDDGNTITVSGNIGTFVAGYPATYTITGSRILGNQEMTISYGEGYEYTLNQSKKQAYVFELPEDFTPDEELLGSWVFRYYGMDFYKVTFNDDGSMVLDFVQDGVKYNGIYTLDGSTVNFTYYFSENKVVPMEYSVDGDNLTFMGYSFVREGSELAEATADQVLTIPQD